MIIDFLKEKYTEYNIVPINESNIDEAFMLMKSNKYFYSRTLFHELTIEECIEDITYIPPNTNLQQKFYVGIYREDSMIALLDYLEGYPSKNIVYIGFFILNADQHGKGLGRYFIETFFQAAKVNGFDEVKLACYEVNERGYLFWSRMGFITEKISKRMVDDRELNLIEMKINFE